jgi:hypothetical protein
MVNCTTKDPAAGALTPVAMTGTAVNFERFNSQRELGVYLTKQYHIRPPNELTSCEVCHR